MTWVPYALWENTQPPTPLHLLALSTLIIACLPLVGVTTSSSRGCVAPPSPPVCFQQSTINFFFWRSGRLRLSPFAVRLLHAARRESCPTERGLALSFPHYRARPISRPQAPWGRPWQDPWCQERAEGGRTFDPQGRSPDLRAWYTGCQVSLKAHASPEATPPYNWSEGEGPNSWRHTPGHLAVGTPSILIW